MDKLGELFNTAYLKAAIMENAVSGIQCTGIGPFDKEILPFTEFLGESHATGEPTNNESYTLPAQTCEPALSTLE